jgi:uncharacterized protein YjbJ (UPF0337 family)
MNRDQLKGSAKDLAGKVQRKAGQASDSPEHTLKGAAKQAEGKIQKAFGNARQDSKRAR